MRVAVVGLGTAGATTACLLADAGHDVRVIEQAPDPSPVGAGIWLQSLGQQVLDRLGILAPLQARSQSVDRIEIVTTTGRRLLDLSFAHVPDVAPALGVHRGDLFALLHEAVRARGVPVEVGVPVTGVRPDAGGMVVESLAGDLGSFDLVVGADGSRSRVRRSMNVTVRDRPYEYGALWAVVEDPDGLAGTSLFQSLRGTREYLGVLPTGRGRASLFWSARHRDMAGVVGAGLPAWRAAAREVARGHGPLLDRVETLLPAGYRDVVVRSPYRTSGPHAAVLVGDSAHAMSPQLGVGTSLALADAWTLAHAVSSVSSLAGALETYRRDRTAHLRWYQWWTRLMMPVFQSDLGPLAWPRDAVAPVLGRLPGAEQVLLRTLGGDRTSPWSGWRLPG